MFYESRSSWSCTQSDETQRRICQICLHSLIRDEPHSFHLFTVSHCTFLLAQPIFGRVVKFKVAFVAKTNKMLAIENVNAICGMHVGTHQKSLWTCVVFFVASGHLDRYFFFLVRRDIVLFRDDCSFWARILFVQQIKAIPVLMANSMLTVDCHRCCVSSSLSPLYRNWY